jgi:ABC-2 type transport system permease protein
MSRRAITRLIARREIAERLQGRMMRVMTIATVVLVVAAIVIPSLLKGTSKPTRIGLVGTTTEALAPVLERAASSARLDIALSGVADDAAARSELNSGRLDVAVSVDRSSARLQVKQTLSPTIRALLAASIDEAHLRQALAQTGVPLTRVLPALVPVPIVTTALHPPASDTAARAVAAIAAALLMYLSLGLYGGAVANGVAQEKTSRAAEVLLAAVRPGQLLAGKVIGIGACGLGQLAIAAAAGLITNALVHSAGIPASVWVLLPSFLVCFLAGFALYAFAFAAAGALVARKEEVQFVTLPLALPLLIGYLLVYAAIASPDATWLRVISFLPPLTASVMPARIALGHIEPWELPLAAVLMLVSIYGMARLASRVYAGALIQGGARLGWREALQPDRRSRVTAGDR